MRIARITGRVSASVKAGALTGRKMLLADYVDAGGNVLEPAAVVTDACGAGPGDVVICVRAGCGSRLAHRHGACAALPRNGAGGAPVRRSGRRGGPRPVARRPGDRLASPVRGMAEERRRTAEHWGVRDLPDTDAWIDLHAGAAAGDMARPVPGPDESRSLVRCAVIGSLAPLLSAAEVAGVAAPVTRAMTTLAAAALGREVTGAGRRLHLIGVDATNLDDARRTLDAIARGEW